MAITEEGWAERAKKAEPIRLKHRIIQQMIDQCGCDPEATEADDDVEMQPPTPQ